MDNKQDENIIPEESVSEEPESKTSLFGTRAVNRIAIFAVVDGNINFDTNTGTILSADKTITFADIPSVLSVSIPDTVKSIGKQAFRNTKITRVVLSDKAATTGEGIIVIPPSVTQMGKEAFRGSKGIENILMPAGITSVGENAFLNCDTLTLRFHH